MTDLANIKKGEAELTLKIEDGSVKIALTYDGKQADAKLEVSLSVDEYLEMLKGAIKGDVDDMIIDGLKGLLLK
jgi:hypothetical protein